eukprot:m.37713 g.37713  ORF g.37713 m.37713 type:complete len:303 (+) comp5460_c0_seq2:1806-2714(+)
MRPSCTPSRTASISLSAPGRYVSKRRCCSSSPLSSRSTATVMPRPASPLALASATTTSSTSMAARVRLEITRRCHVAACATPTCTCSSCSAAPAPGPLRCSRSRFPTRTARPTAATSTCSPRIACAAAASAVSLWRWLGLIRALSGPDKDLGMLITTALTVLCLALLPLAALSQQQICDNYGVVNAKECSGFCKSHALTGAFTAAVNGTTGQCCCSSSTGVKPIFCCVSGDPSDGSDCSLSSWLTCAPRIATAAASCQSCLPNTGVCETCLQTALASNLGSCCSCLWHYANEFNLPFLKIDC